MASGAGSAAGGAAVGRGAAARLLRIRLNRLDGLLHVHARGGSFAFDADGLPIRLHLFGWHRHPLHIRLHRHARHHALPEIGRDLELPLDLADGIPRLEGDRQDVHRRRGVAAGACDTRVGTLDARHLECPVGPHDDIFGDSGPRPHHAQRQQLRADRHLSHDASFDIHRDLRRAGIIGDKNQLPLDIPGRSFWFELERQFVGGLTGSVDRLGELHLEV